MKNFIEVTVADGCKVLIRIDNIDYITDYGREKTDAEIYFKIGQEDHILHVRESRIEIAALIETATEPQLSPRKDYKNNVKEIDRELTGDITEASFLKTSIKCYEFDDVSDDWADGWSSAIKWCLDKVDRFFGVKK